MERERQIDVPSILCVLGSFLCARDDDSVFVSSGDQKKEATEGAACPKETKIRQLEEEKEDLRRRFELVSVSVNTRCVLNKAAGSGSSPSTQHTKTHTSFV